MRAPCRIGGESISAGSSGVVRLPLPDFYTHAPTTMPVQIFHGRRSGPTLLVTSALHGDEINGVEIIRRLSGRAALARIRGTLILVPVVNVFGFVAQSRYLPDRRDLNRSFPGSSKGSMAARLANLVTTELLPTCTHVIDLHTGAVARENLPQIRAAFSGNTELAELGHAFNAPVMIDAPLRDGTFRQTAQQHDIPALVYEAGEALRFDELSVRAGVSGILNVLSHLEMIRKRKSGRAQSSLLANSTHWVRAPQSGVVRALPVLGTSVGAGERMALIGDPFGGHEEEVLSPIAGIVIGRTRVPLVHEGDALFHIAKFPQPSEVADSIEQFQDAFDPVSETGGD